MTIGGGCGMTPKRGTPVLGFCDIVNFLREVTHGSTYLSRRSAGVIVGRDLGLGDWAGHDGGSSADLIDVDLAV